MFAIPPVPREQINKQNNPKQTSKMVTTGFYLHIFAALSVHLFTSVQNTESAALYPNPQKLIRSWSVNSALLDPEYLTYNQQLPLPQPQSRGIQLQPVNSRFIPVTKPLLDASKRAYGFSVGK
ncbi:uncharacterized protein LOC142336779 [Convolutriloba macropyga]|uniref:uncharacterized protein LOC142336779 n=1 Tax=Convolutriloba macropyga TaxID=536237 RepID=UPI003F51DB57